MIFLKTKIAQKPMMSTVSKIMFGIGSLGFCMVSQTATSLLMFFGTVAHLMPGTLMGIAMLIGTIWDGGSDPIFGALSDRAKARFSEEGMDLCFWHVWRCLSQYYAMVAALNFPDMAQIYLVCGVYLVVSNL